MDKVKFYKNKNDGTVIALMNGTLSDDNYLLLKVNDTDAAIEKHVPVYEKDGNEIIVSVGSVLHPMQEEHYIMWIAYVYGNKIEITKLNPNDEPKAIYKFVSGAEIYAYCNLHGLWKSTIM